MKITGVDTVRNRHYPALIWVQVHTDEGITGLGETTYTTGAVEAFIHAEAAQFLLGEDPRRIDTLWNAIRSSARVQTTRSAELKALSAIDVALWDIAGQAAGVPVYDLLGGPARDRVRVYNTCAGPTYAMQGSHAPPESGAGQYEDLYATLNHAGELAESLLAEGFTAMKIWPFEAFYPETDGQSISLVDLKRGLEPFEKIRTAVGNRIEIAVDMLSQWSVPAILRIARALEQFDLMWIEDPMPINNIDSLADFRDRVNIPVTASETVATREGFREMFERRAMDICMLDVTWCGGLSEAKKIATAAETYKLPVAPHDCTGPVTLMAGVHLSINAPNGLIQETVRAFNNSWYPVVVDRLPRIEQGHVYAPTDPGLGMALRPEFFTDPETTLRKSSA